MKTFVLLLAIVMSGCAGGSLKPTDVNRNETRQAQQVRQGTVLDVYEITIKGNTTAAQGVGAGLGGYAANRAVKDSNELTKVAATAVGVLVGSVVGNTLSDVALDKPGVSLIIKLDNGGTLAVTQQSDNRVRFTPGERVWLIGRDNNVRIIPE